MTTEPSQPTSRPSRRNRAVGIVFCVIAAALLVTSIIITSNTLVFLADAERADGVVVDMERRETEFEEKINGSWYTRTRVSYHPVTTFEVDGQEYTFTSSVSTDPPRYEIGDDVVVLFDPANPHDARIDGAGVYLAMAITGGLAVIFGVFGWMLLRKGRTKKAVDAGDDVDGDILTT